MTWVPLRARLLRILPPWMQPSRAPRGFRVLYAIATVADALIETARQGVIADLPGEGTTTALAPIGRDRGIRRGFAESAAAFIVRLLTWREDHKRRGNPYTLMRQVRGYLSPHKPLMRLVNARGTWYTLNPDDTRERHALMGNWDWDGDPTLPHRAWLIIYPPAELWTRDGTWGDGAVWGEEAGTWGSTATEEQVQAVRAIIDEWRSGTALYVSVIVCFDAAAFDPTGSGAGYPSGDWDRPYRIVGGVAEFTRDDRAIYWRGA